MHVCAHTGAADDVDDVEFLGTYQDTEAPVTAVC